MPQMMPINWILSLLLFILLFIIFNMMNYFIFNNKHSSNNINKMYFKKKNILWKW
uniref:ATP synthase complex subunit 8 n=1 Tax=Tirumala limniace TaxID=551222 RepID=A0A0A7HDU1_TIRLI|nr:ATP synthase F0 subunit 8 [Tirumala limniace]APL97264.1 ATP synthase F0 subunit 8 [Tirumala limniace]